MNNIIKITLCLLTVLLFADSSFAEGGDHDGHHDHEGEHMSHMMEVKNMLKKELGESYDKPLPPITEENLAKGKVIFQTNCAVCHGTNGKGDGLAAAGLQSKPADFTDPAHSGLYSDQGRLWIVKYGIPGTPMTGWSKVIGEDGAFNVLSYVKSLSANPNNAKVANRHSKNEGQSDSSSVLESYLKFGAALAGDNSLIANKAVSELEVNLKSEKTEYSKELVARIQNTSSDADLIELRKLYAEVSAKIVPAFENESIKAKKAFCPMAQSGKGGYWLQEGKEIQNPYFGSEMLTCGEWSISKKTKAIKTNTAKNIPKHNHK